MKKVACWDEGLRRVLEGQRVENPYALIDALTYGFEGDNVACWESSTKADSRRSFTDIMTNSRSSSAGRQATAQSGPRDPR